MAEMQGPFPEQLQNLAKPFSGVSAALQTIENAQKPRMERGYTLCTIGNKIYYVGSPRKPKDDRTTKSFISLIQVFNTETKRWEEDIVIKGWCPEQPWNFLAFPHCTATEESIVLHLGKTICKLNMSQKVWEELNVSLDVPKSSEKLFRHERAPGTQTLPIWDEEESLNFFSLSLDGAKPIPTSAEEDAEDDELPSPPKIFPWGDVPYYAAAMWTFYVGKTLLSCSFHNKYPDVLSIHIHDPVRKNWIKLSEFARPASMSRSFVGVHRVGSCLIFAAKNKSNTLELAIHDFITGTSRSVPIGASEPVNNSDGAMIRVGKSLNLKTPVAEETDAMIQVSLCHLPSDADVAAFDAAFDEYAASRLQAQQPAQKQIDTFVESDVLKERDIIIDDGLEPCAYNAQDSLNHHSDLQQSLSGLFIKTKVVSTNFLRHNLPLDAKSNVPLPDHVFHKNLVSYLTLAYDYHFSVIITPDMIFYTLLAELAETIKAEPKRFEKLFTSTPGEKQKIVVPTADPSVLDLEAIIAKLREKLPSDADMFTARFSTTTFDSRLAMNAAFADAMSPYYEYGNTYCGIPRIRIMGTKADWESLGEKIKQWHALLTPVGGQLNDWLTSAQEAILDIHTQRSPEFWKNMFSINRCTSGHTDVVDGWICRIYRRCGSSRRFGKLEYSSGRDFYNFDTHISTVRWTFEDEGPEQKFVMFTGLLYSKILRSDDPVDQKFPFLEPHFAHAVQGDGVPPSAADYERYIEGLPAGDASFLTRYRNYMDEPVIFETGEAKDEQRRKLVIAKFKKLAAKAATESQMTPVYLKFDHIFLSDIGGAPDDADEASDFPPVYQDIFQAIRDFIRTGKFLSAVDFSNFRNDLNPMFDSILTALQGHPSLAKLVFDSNTVKFNAAALADLLRHPQCRLQSLQFEFSGSVIDDEDTAVVAAALKDSSAPIDRIQATSVSSNVFGAILSRTFNRSHPLRHLKVRMSALRTDESMDLVIAALKEVEKSEFASFPLESLSASLFYSTKDCSEAKCIEMANAFVALLRRCSSLKVCDTMSCKSEKVTSVIAAAIANTQSIEEIVGDSSTDDGTMAGLVSKLKGLRVIDNVGSSLTCEAVAAAISRRECELTRLILPKRDIDTSAVSKLFDAISTHGCPSLREINFYHCSIDSGAAPSIAAALSSPNCAIKTLRLGGNNFDLDALLTIMAALGKNSSVEMLYFDYSAGAIEKSSHPQILKAIGEALKANSTLLSFVISLTGVNKQNLDEFAETINDNTTIFSFSIEMWGGSLMEKVDKLLKRNMELRDAKSSPAQ